jgi:hypothetical protein
MFLRVIFLKTSDAPLKVLRRIFEDILEVLIQQNFEKNPVTEVTVSA